MVGANRLPGAGETSALDRPVIGDQGRLLSLRFVINRTGMQEELMASSLARRLRGVGVELLPESAQGKPVLAVGVSAEAISRAPANWHVLVREPDEAEVCKILGMDVTERFVIPEAGHHFPQVEADLPSIADTDLDSVSSSSDSDGPMCVVGARYCVVCNNWLGDIENWGAHHHTVEHQIAVVRVTRSDRCNKVARVC